METGCTKHNSINTNNNNNSKSNTTGSINNHDNNDNNSSSNGNSNRNDESRSSPGTRGRVGGMRGIPVSVKNTPFRWTSALQSRGGNCSPAPDLAPWRLIIQSQLFSGGVFLSQTPVCPDVDQGTPFVWHYLSNTWFLQQWRIVQQSMGILDTTETHTKQARPQQTSSVRQVVPPK